MIGRVLGSRYRVEAKLGSGSFAHVYRAFDLGFGRTVAVKVLSDPNHRVGGSLRPRFEREAQALATLQHPSIVELLEYGLCEGMPYIVMEIAPGQTLSEIIERGGVSAERAVRIALEILHALAFAHARGVVHRDLKPENVVLTPEDRIKILDFGFATFAGPSARNVPLALTAAGTSLGTPGYMSPEQAFGRGADARTDLYALGAILFELLTGKPPYEGQGMQLVRNHISAPVPSLAAVRTDIPNLHALDALLTRALAKDPANRFPDAHSMGYALEQAWAGASPIAAPIAGADAAAPAPATRPGPEAPRQSPEPPVRIPGASAIPPWAIAVGAVGILFMVIAVVAVAMLFMSSKGP